MKTTNEKKNARDSRFSLLPPSLSLSISSHHKVVPKEHLKVAPEAESPQGGGDGVSPLVGCGGGRRRRRRRRRRRGVLSSLLAVHILADRNAALEALDEDARGHQRLEGARKADVAPPAEVAVEAREVRGLEGVSEEGEKGVG